MSRQTSTQAHQQKSTATPAGGGLLQRQCACGNHIMVGGECVECGKKKQTLQRASFSSRVKADSITTSPLPAGERVESEGSLPAIVHEVLRSPGQPLDPTMRAFFEPRFGHDFSGVQVHTASPQMTSSDLTLRAAGDRYEQEADRVADTVMRQMEVSAQSASSPCQAANFSQVRIHTDERAAVSARAVNALAYTVGRDVVFGTGQYTPNTRAGQRLMAHELAHTLQQTSGLRPTVQRKLEVGAGLTLDTKGFSTTRTGNVYTCPATVKNSVWNELFTALLFSPRVFKLDGTSDTQVNANLDKHMTARYGIVEFASKKKYTFAAGSAFKMNPAYWIVDATGWRLKPGADREKAIEDLNVNPKEYAIACLAATQLTMQGGSKSPLTDDTGVAVTDWIPGDWGYITNTKFPSGGTPGLEGENIIYTGKDKFWGHFGPGNEYKTLLEWFDQVKSWHGGAKTEDFRTRPTIGLV